MDADLFHTRWQDDFGGMREQVDSFVKKYLQIDRRDKPTLCPKEKFIHDSLWGNLRFTSGEILLIDSPLLQRLRYIRQLGLASFLYPGATHTRFEHTLGVTHLAGKIAERVAKLQERSGDAFQAYSGSKDLTIVSVVRIAALFHDVGHLFFSHAGEKGVCDIRMACSRKIDDMLYTVFEVFPSEKPSLAEILSALILTSTHMSPLLAEACAAIRGEPTSSPSPALPEKVAAIAACFILGVAPNSELAPFASILSSTLDADKCDYLCRDSIYTGVPVAVDINRIIDQLDCVPMPLDEGADELTNDFFERPPQDSDGNYFRSRLAIKNSAARNIDDMLISRALMYEKVYFHQKILTAEQTFRQGLQQLELACPEFFFDVGRLLELVDHDFLGTEKASGFKAFIDRHALKLEDETAFNNALHIFSDISARHFYKRCCVLSENILFAPPQNGNTSQETVQKFLKGSITDPENAVAPKEFENKIFLEVQRMAKALGKSVDGQFEYSKIFVAPYGKSSISNVNFPIALDTKKGKKYNQLFNIESWQDSRQKQIAQSLVLAPESLVTIAHLAVEIVLYRDYNILLSAEYFAAHKINRDEYYKEKDKLIKQGWYSKAPVLIDLETQLAAADDKILIDLVHKFGSYRPGILPNSEKETGVGGAGALITRQHILSFMRQFTPFIPQAYDPKNFYSALLAVLNNTQLLHQNDVAQALGKVLHAIEQDTVGAIIFPLGNFKDSATHLGYYFSKQIKSGRGSIGIQQMCDIKKYLTSNDCFIFYDDAFYSGSQVISMFKCLLGKNKKHNEHIEPLLDTDAEKFCTKSIYLIYDYGNENKKENLEKEFKKMGINVIIKYATPYPQKIFDLPYDKNVKKYISEVKKAFATIGEQLLQPNLTNKLKFWNKNRVENSVLGYDNAEQGIIYAWNTPTSTLTALWKSGEVCVGEDRFPWTPLFPRDEK